jgi:hypothetical protein
MQLWEKEIEDRKKQEAIDSKEQEKESFIRKETTRIIEQMHKEALDKECNTGKRKVKDCKRRRKGNYGDEYDCGVPHYEWGAGSVGAGACRGNENDNCTDLKYSPKYGSLVSTSIIEGFEEDYISDSSKMNSDLYKKIYNDLYKKYSKEA